MSGKIITALLFIVCSSLSAFAGGVTNIKEVINRSSKSVRVSAYDNKTLLENGHNNMLRTPVLAAGGSWRGDMWVPWADDKKQFRSHFMAIEIFQVSPRAMGPVQIFGVYQTGEEIRSSLVKERNTNQSQIHYLVEEDYNATAPKVEGDWQSGGERRIIFSDKPDGSVGFKVERYGR